VRPFPEAALVHLARSGQAPLASATKPARERNADRAVPSIAKTSTSIRVTLHEVLSLLTEESPRRLRYDLAPYRLPKEGGDVFLARAAVPAPSQSDFRPTTSVATAAIEIANATSAPTRVT
jgi:hypothetical protein